MQISFALSCAPEEGRLLGELADELGVTLAPDGLPLRVVPCDEGFRVRLADGAAEIGRSTLPSLARGFGLLVEHAGEPNFGTQERCRFADLFALVDCARNAVPTVETVKRACRLLSLMGFSRLILYLEDLFPVEGEPYFGQMRGRFSAAELRECDDYAASLGIELSPAVQTLAHLNGIFRWSRFRRIQDCADILLADDAETYAFLDAMLGALSGLFRSRRVNIGMDEAHLLGAGQHLARFGYQPRPEIMLRHLDRVVGLCRKHGLQPAMWSDMFFRMQSDAGRYYDPVSVDPAVAASLPEGLALVYWDYYHRDEGVYDRMFRQHAVFKNEIRFAGGAWKWMGPAPLLRASLAFSRSGLRSALRNGIRSAGVTAWGDNGSSCPLFTVLPVWQCYAEAAWTGRTDDASLDARLRACTGLSLDDALLLESANLPPEPGERNPFANPASYLLFQDPLLGLFDRHLLPGRYAPYYADAATALEEAADRVEARWRYLFTGQAALCRVLSRKAELGVRLKSAYDAGDRAALSTLANDELPCLLVDLQTLFAVQHEQWLREFRPFGLEANDIRVAGVTARVHAAKQTLDRYLAGSLDRIPELEEPRLRFDCRPEDSREPLGLEIYRWDEIASPNLL